MSTMSTAPRTATSKAYDELIRRVRETHLIDSTGQLLGWDQEVFMPEGGVAYRSDQLALLARLAHESFTDPAVGDLIDECAADRTLTADPLAPTAVNIRELRRDFDRRTKLPAALVEEEARLSSLGQHVWREARAKSDFAVFRPTLEKIVDMVRRKAACYGWAKGGEPWDALAEDYEPGCTAASVEAVFTPLRERLQALLNDLMGSGRGPSNAFNECVLPQDAQLRFVRWVSERIGFDYARGRLDRSTHPFCSGTHCNDVRLTTRFRDTDVNDALGSTMHESGHGIYEQGLLAAHIGTPMGEAVSLGIHESQSRMWENQVGRSRAFWRFCAPHLKDFFGDATAHLDEETIYGGANIVSPGFIRVEADEATYNMHIMVRFELERALLKGDMEVADIPGAWNEKYKSYLALDVPDDRRGCLQDIHWSGGSMGYFPTYTLGNLYAAQLFEAATEAMPDLDAQFARGEFGALKTWLNENVHAHGRRYKPRDLCEHVTGKPLSADPLMRHLEGKLRPLYGV